jgi:hypothetical protein
LVEKLLIVGGINFVTAETDLQWDKVLNASFGFSVSLLDLDGKKCTESTRLGWDSRSATIPDISRSIETKWDCLMMFLMKGSVWGKLRRVMFIIKRLN